MNYVLKKKLLTEMTIVHRNEIKEGQTRNQFHLVGLENSETPSTSSVWPSYHREDYMSCAWPFYRSFHKCCTLTNKAVGTIWRALSKPPQRRQGTDPHPLQLLVGTPSAFGPELAYRLCVAQPTLMDVPIYFWYILLYYYICFVYHTFMTSSLWLAVGPQSL